MKLLVGQLVRRMGGTIVGNTVSGAVGGGVTVLHYHAHWRNYCSIFNNQVKDHSVELSMEQHTMDYTIWSLLAGGAGAANGFAGGGISRDAAIVAMALTLGLGTVLHCTITSKLLKFIIMNKSHNYNIEGPATGLQQIVYRQTLH